MGFDMIASMMKDKLNILFTKASPFIPALAVVVILTALIFWMESDRSKRLSERRSQRRIVYVYVENPNTPANDQAVCYHTNANTPAKRNLRRATFNRFRRAFHHR